MSDIPSWLDSVATTVGRLRDRFGPRWVVGVSGGSDSVALLLLLTYLAPDLSLSVAHLDHGTRGDLGRDDARFVGDLAERLGLPFDLGEWAPTRPSHFEADARRARYAWLAEVARDRGAGGVAVGHTRDDQAETVLHRIVRGTGPRGLAGIPRSRPLAEGVSLIRPLLDVGRDDLRAYLAAIGQTWRDDATNLDTSRTRSRIRHELLPELARSFNPGVAEALVRLSRLSRETVAAVEERVAGLVDAIVRGREESRVVLDRGLLAELSPFLRAEVMRTVWRSSGWPESAMDAGRWRSLAARATGPEGTRDIGAGVRVAVTTDRVVLWRSVAAPDLAPLAIPLELPGAADWPGGRIEATILDSPDQPATPCAEWIDLDRLTPPLRIESARPGDRFDPLGLAGKTTPLADFFRARHVARADRPLVPLVKDATGIVWVVGHRISDRVRLTDATRRVVRLRWVDAPEISRCDTPSSPHRA
jgi:tRNA(Ile)-lysidine synthase